MRGLRTVCTTVAETPVVRVCSLTSRNPPRRRDGPDVTHPASPVGRWLLRGPVRTVTDTRHVVRTSRNTSYVRSPYRSNLPGTVVVGEGVVHFTLTIASNGRVSVSTETSSGGLWSGTVSPRPNPTSVKRLFYHTILDFELLDLFNFEHQTRIKNPTVELIWSLLLRLCNKVKRTEENILGMGHLIEVHNET